MSMPGRPQIQHWEKAEPAQEFPYSLNSQQGLNSKPWLIDSRTGVARQQIQELSMSGQSIFMLAWSKRRQIAYDEPIQLQHT
jgi:hypothetical protein